MSNEVTKKSSHEIVDDGFEEFEDRVEGSEERTGSVVQRPIIGFTNEAEWVNKDSDEKLPADRELVAIQHFRVVQKWKDGLPIKDEERVLQPGEKWPDVRRLNDAVPREEWVDGPDGQPRGPWQAQHVIRLFDPRTMDRFSYPTGTVGGGMCVRDLVDRVKLMRQYRGENVYPVVTLTDTFMPTRYGGRQRPHFNIVKWIKLGDGGGILSPTESPALSGPQTVEEPTAKEVVDDEIKY
jgi:hypothetical protein